MATKSTPWYKKGIYRSTTDRFLSGLVGGIADYTGVSSTLLRLAFVVVTAFTGFVPGIAVYVIGSIIVPEKNNNKS